METIYALIQHYFLNTPKDKLFAKYPQIPQHSFPSPSPLTILTPKEKIYPLRIPFLPLWWMESNKYKLKRWQR